MTKKDKDKLLTVNRFNKPRFAQGVDRVNNNIFDGTGSSFIDQKIANGWWDEWMKNNGFITNKTSASPQSSVQVPIVPISSVGGIGAGFGLPAITNQRIRTNSYIGPTIGTTNGLTIDPNRPKDYFVYNPSIASNPTIAPVAQIGIDKMGGRGTGLGNVVDAVSSIAPLTKDMIKPTSTSSKKLGFNWKAAAPAIGSGVGMIGNHVISDGFNTETGTAIANAGNMIGQAIGMANPILGGIISAGSGLLGGFWNRGFGVDVDKKKEAAVKSNIAAARNTGNELAQATDNQAVINAAGNMVSGVNTNVARNGLFNHKGDEINADYEKKQNSALAGQVQGLAMGADNADSIQGNNAQRYNTVAFGGPLDSLMYNNDNMGAIEYGLLLDYVTGKNKQADMKNRMPGIAGMPNNMFALGGDKKIVASPSSVRVQKYPTNKQIKRKFTQDDYIHAGVYPSKNGGYHILDSDYKEIPISNEEAYRRVSEHAPIQDKAKARNAWQDMFGPWYTEYALGGDIQTHGADYSIGQVYDVTEEEANRLKAMGYEFKIVN